jgi:hypothetical protein
MGFHFEHMCKLSCSVRVTLITRPVSEVQWSELLLDFVTSNKNP